jgi:quinol monooxygenase YgiN
MISVTHFVARSDDFATRAEAALAILAQKPGYVRGQLARSTDDEREWVLITEWENVGSYRRSLGGMDAKMIAMPLLAEAIDVPSSFETLATGSPDGTIERSDSDREPTVEGQIP